MPSIKDTNWSSLLSDEQGSNPATPASGQWRIFTKSDGLYVIDDTGSVTGPFGTGGVTLLDTQEVTGSDATITFSSIPATYDELRIVGRLRSDHTGGGDIVLMRVGATSVDTGTNYDSAYSVEFGASTTDNSVQQAGTSWRVGNVTDENLTASEYGLVDIYIPEYADTGAYRHFRSAGGHVGSSNGRNWLSNGHWLNTADAIDTITLFPNNGTNFKVGSKLRLYGIG